MFREKPTDPIATNLACPAFYVLRNSSLPLVRCPRLCLAHPERSLLAQLRPSADPTGGSCCCPQRRGRLRVDVVPTAAAAAERDCAQVSEFLAQPSVAADLAARESPGRLIEWLCAYPSTPKITRCAPPPYRPPTRVHCAPRCPASQRVRPMRARECSFRRTRIYGSKVSGRYGACLAS